MVVSLFLYLFFAQSGQRDVIAHSKEAHKTDEKEADNHDEANINAQGVKSPIEQSACNACHGVNLFAEDEGHIVMQPIMMATQKGWPKASVFCRPAMVKRASPSVSNTNQALLRRLTYLAKTMMESRASTVQIM